MIRIYCNLKQIEDLNIDGWIALLYFSYKLDFVLDEKREAKNENKGKSCCYTGQKYN